MDLYDFIRNDFLKPSPKDEGTREDFAAEREMPQDKISAPQKELLETLARMERVETEKQTCVNELEQVRKDFAAEREMLQDRISARQKELLETLARMERVETEKQTCVNELEQVRQDFAAFKQKTKIAIFIAIVVAIAGFIYS